MGERVDIFAPGSDIFSTVYDQSSATEGNYAYLPLADPRDNSYYLSIYNWHQYGKSTSLWNTLLVLQNKNRILLKQKHRQHLIENSLPEISSQGLPEQSPYEGFGDSNNRYAFIPKEKT